MPSSRTIGCRRCGSASTVGPASMQHLATRWPWPWLATIHVLLDNQLLVHHLSTQPSLPHPPQFSWLFYLPMALFCPPDVYALHRGLNTAYQVRFHMLLLFEAGSLRAARHGARTCCALPLQLALAKVWCEAAVSTLCPAAPAPANPPTCARMLQCTHPPSHTDPPNPAVLCAHPAGGPLLVGGGSRHEHAQPPQGAPRPQLRPQVRGARRGMVRCVHCSEAQLSL